MKSIGFKNFRRFVNFPSLELGEITLMVGGNNSEKSTLVKSILLTLDYLRTQQGDKMYFDKNTLNDVNIVTFGRAKCNYSDSREIVFDCTLGKFAITIVTKGEDDDTFANVMSLVIKDRVNKINLEINFQAFIISFEMDDSSDDEFEQFQDFEIQDLIKKAIELLQEQLEKTEDWNKKLKIQSEINNQETKLKRSAGYKKSSNNKNQNGITKVEYPINNRLEFELTENSFEENINDFIINNRNMISVAQGKQSNISASKLVDMKYLDLHSDLLYKFTDELKSTLYKNRFVYLAAHSTKQSALFSIRDKENMISVAIHEFHQLKLDKLSDERRFVISWMKEFEIGTNFEIKPQASEAYTFKIESEGNWIHLGDKGMGSIQAMTLILQLATIIRKYKGQLEGCIVIIEEPELNMHPKLQSKLAELFEYINKTYGIRFIVETHSEYLIRKTQVIVANENYKDQKDVDENNKFRVYYFPKKELPYSMGYSQNGRFIEKFDSGFFDVASENSLNLSRIERERR
jgi:predicted ATPase